MSLIGYRLLHKEIDSLSEDGMNFVRHNFYRQRTNDHYRCKRDIKYILWGISRCLLHQDVNRITEISHKFVQNGKLVLKDIRIELATYAYIESKLHQLFKDLDNDLYIAIEALALLKENFTKLEEANYTRNFSDLIKERKTTFGWKNKEVPISVVEDILLDLHVYAPSKQSRTPYYLDVLDWGNEKLRHDIFEWCWRNPDHDAEEDWGNPQVLAPYLFAFTPRGDIAHESFLEIGIASSFIIWNAQSRGLSTGYCACIQDPSAVSDALGRPGTKVTVLLGLGYKDNKATSFIDPRTNKPQDFPKDNSYHKSNQQNTGTYIQWH